MSLNSETRSPSPPQGFPHVIYAKIWRWPDLHKNELKHVKYCKYAFDLKCDSVCVNPYHYERVISPAIDLSNLSLNSNSVQQAAAAITPNYQYNHQLNNSSLTPMNLLGGPKEEPKTFTNLDAAYTSQGAHNQFDIWSSASAQQLNQLTNSPVCSSLPFNHSPLVGLPHPAGRSSIDHLNGLNGPSLAHSPTLVNTNEGFWSTGSGNQLATHENSSPNCNPASAAVSSLGSPAAVSLAQQPLHSAGGHSLINLSNLPLPEYWCSIAYYELDQQVGETFKVPSSIEAVKVDGYVDPSREDRFCLGALSNVHRTDKIEKARLHIGKGVMLWLHREG